MAKIVHVIGVGHANLFLPYSKLFRYLLSLYNSKFQFPSRIMLISSLKLIIEYEVVPAEGAPVFMYICICVELFLRFLLSFRMWIFFYIFYSLVKFYWRLDVVFVNFLHSKFRQNF